VVIGQAGISEGLGVVIGCMWVHKANKIFAAISNQIIDYFNRNLSSILVTHTGLTIKPIKKTIMQKV